MLKIRQLRLDTIGQIEACPECSANEYAFMKRIGFKGCFNIYFLDFGGYFGKSMLVYRNGHHVYYANDYELHHRLGWSCFRTGEPEFFGVCNLIKSYLKKAGSVLFSDDEIFNEKIKTYDEYQRKSYYARNYAPMQFDYVSAFYIGEKQKKEVQSKLAKLSKEIYVPSLFLYVSRQEECDYLTSLNEAVRSQYATIMNDDGVFREAVSYELANHEACISGEYDEALAALGLDIRNLSAERQSIVLQELSSQIHQYDRQGYIG